MAGYRVRRDDHEKFLRSEIVAGGKVEVYTDGSQDHGTGGWAAVISAGRAVFVLKGREADCHDSVRMEMMAAYEAIRFLDDTAVRSAILRTDCRMLVENLTLGEPVLNWLTDTKAPTRAAMFAELLRPRRWRIDWNWIRGHAGDRFNSMADRHARAERLQMNIA